MSKDPPALTAEIIAKILQRLTTGEREAVERIRRVDFPGAPQIEFWNRWLGPPTGFGSGTWATEGGPNPGAAYRAARQHLQDVLFEQDADRIKAELARLEAPEPPPSAATAGALQRRPPPSRGYRDEDNAIARQVLRERGFGTEPASEQDIWEITDADAKLLWRVAGEEAPRLPPPGKRGAGEIDETKQRRLRTAFKRVTGR